ncbi:MbtH family protein [Sphingomonas sp. LB2R24]|uniref:MbtH family protein n=1 Tax=Sphingomonas sorbitolis TaxID=3096165 RepID=UPI002FC7681B
MSNPFDAEDGEFFVLVNEEGQHSLWPTFAKIPDGWEKRFGPDDKAKCLDYVNNSWQDMRPVSLIRQMDADSASEAPLE